MYPTVLIIGGSGVFGSRLAERLALSCDCRILVAGRSVERVAEIARSIAAGHPRARIEPLVLDRERVTAEQVRSTGAAIVVDAAGPFQSMDLRFAQTVIAAGCHYIDLADARDFIEGFPQLNEAALAANVLAVCGASSTPALSHAALDHLAPTMGTPEEIRVYISPGNRAPRGLSVVKAILSYAGRPVTLQEHGRERTRPGWSLLHRRKLEGLQTRWFSLCETPDLDLIPARFPEVRSAYFFAGLELGILHCGLWVLSLLVRARLLSSLVPFASGLLAIARRFERFGTDRGGMLVEVKGWDTNGQRITSRWGLRAEGGDGPYIPTLPALAVIRRLLSGQETRRGAQACAGLLTLEDIAGEFRGLRIQTYQEKTTMEPLFKRTLGASFDRMPHAVRELHYPQGAMVYKGISQIDKAASFLGTLAARAFGFPPAGSDVPVEVTLTPDAHSEAWRRRFGTAGFASVLGCDARKQQLTEQFGLIRFTLNVECHDQGLDMQIESARLGILPLPRFLVPWTRACERVDEQGRFTFDVEIGMRGIGRLVRYRGWLQRE
jgi:saccharopine dehydrogenase-like NADP-dependent oxidoreductase